MQRKIFRNGREEWEDLGPGRARRHTPVPPESVVTFMVNLVSVKDARRELDQEQILHRQRAA